MSLKTYIDLIEAFAAEVGLDAQALANTQEVVIDGLPIGLSYEGNEEFGDILYFVEVGAPQDARKAQVYETLLAANYLWAGTGGATLGVHQDTKQVILAGRCEVEGITAEGLALLLDALAETAQFWKGYVAGEQPAPEMNLPPTFAMRV